MAALSPTARMRPSRTARACAMRDLSSRVTILALWTMRSGGGDGGVAAMRAGSSRRRGRQRFMRRAPWVDEGKHRRAERAREGANANRQLPRYRSGPRFIQCSRCGAAFNEAVLDYEPAD